MKEFLNKLLKYGKMSLTSDNSVSSTRLQSYVVLLLVVLFALGTLLIECWSFYHAIHLNTPYHISNEFIGIFGMMLAHHLSILFSRTKTPIDNLIEK